MNSSFTTFDKQDNKLFLLLSLVLLAYHLTNSAHGLTNSSRTDNSILCMDQEREALLKFKQGIQFDRCGLLSSWVDRPDNRNCCKWNGVRCSNSSSRVIMLNLRGVIETYSPNERCLQGKLGSSLADLEHLRYLDLSFNYFQNQPIPTSIASLVHLKHLNLSHSGFGGEIPLHLGNLSRLTSLDLSYRHDHWLKVTSLSWLSRLTLLKYINLSGVDLSKATNWLQIINNLPFLRILYLDSCILPSRIILPISYDNSSTTLDVLSVGFSYLNDTSIFQWLFNLSQISTQLAHVDFSGNELGGPLPNIFGDMHTLSYLDLNNNHFQGNIPASFGNMHTLSYLDLSWNNFHGNIPTSFGNIHSLSFLSLCQNQLEGPIPSSFESLHELTFLDLSYNNFGSFPKMLATLCSLTELYLNNNNLSDELPNMIQTLTGCANNSLTFFDLSGNKIWGPIPDLIGTLSSLKALNLNDNRLNGTISESLGQLSMLETLYLSNNTLKGILSKTHFSNLSSLTFLDLSNNPSLTLEFDANWVPSFQLQYIFLADCRLGLFPKWLMTQTMYLYLDISNAGISDNIPNSFWNSLPSTLYSLNVSHNNIYGTLPNLQSLNTPYLDIDLSFNNIEGSIPLFPINFTSLRLNDNRFSDPMPFLCPKVKLALSYLDLSNNLLSGPLPDCWMNFEHLSILLLQNNTFTSGIPISFGYLKRLEVLHLSNNNFSGELPRSFHSLKSLVILDLSHNSLSGHIPPAIGDISESLGFLSLRSNNFVGGIPLSLCRLSSLQILDLSINNIFGTIPKCIHNLTAMRTETDLLPTLEYDMQNHNTSYSYINYKDAATIIWKRKEWSFENSLGLVKQIDLSSNKLEGEIPVEISNLIGLVSLDLSRNNLVGTIPPNIGQLTALQVLDLSHNHLYGQIPTSMVGLNFLGILDLSYNHLSGKIPNGPLLQGFEALAYAGNPKLCGLPLLRCSWDQPPNTNAVNGDNIARHDDDDDDDESENIFPGLYISVVLGFIVGFWGVCGTLVLKRSWRHGFFRFLDNVRDRLYVAVSLSIAGVLQRRS